jgi:hypothetical protein
MPFMSLPAELRVQVYHRILEATSSPTFHTLRDYQGLILASKSIYTEFECEAVKYTTHLQSQIHQQWQSPSPLRTTPPTQLNDFSSLRIEVPVERLFQGQINMFPHVLTISEFDTVWSYLPIPELDTFWPYLLNHVSTFTALPYDPSGALEHWRIKARLSPLYDHLCAFVAREKGEEQRKLTEQESNHRYGWVTRLRGSPTVDSKYVDLMIGGGC